jgi:lysophospholipase L1-like esterase
MRLLPSKRDSRWLLAGVVVALAVCAGGCGGSSSTGSSAKRATKAWHLVAIGDSIPYGAEDCGGCVPFPELYAKAIARDTNMRVVADNRAQHTGLTSTDLRQEIAGDAGLRKAVAAADILTVTIGHNDTPWNREDDPCDGKAVGPQGHWSSYRGGCLSATATRYGRDLDAVLREVDGLRAGKRGIIRVTNDYNDVLGEPSAPAAARAASKRVLDAYSSLTCQVARRHHAACIDTYHAFNGAQGTRDAAALLAADHTHPSAEGHQKIAALLVQAGYAPLH